MKLSTKKAAAVALFAFVFALAVDMASPHYGLFTADGDNGGGYSIEFGFLF